MYAKKKHNDGGVIPNGILPTELAKMLMYKFGRKSPAVDGGMLEEAVVTAQAPSRYEKAAAQAYANAEGSPKNAYMTAGYTLADDDVEAAWKEYKAKQAMLGTKTGNPTENFKGLSQEEKDLFVEYLMKEKGIMNEADSLEGSLKALEGDQAKRSPRVAQWSPTKLAPNRLGTELAKMLMEKLR